MPADLLEYARRMARKFCRGRNTPDADDFESWAVEAAWKAFTTHDPKLGTAKLRSWVGQNVEWALSRCARHHNPIGLKRLRERCEFVSLDSQAPLGSSLGSAISDLEADPGAFDAAEMARIMSDRAAVAQALGTLEPAERSAVLCVFYGQETIYCWARRVGVTESTGDYTLKRALKKLREVLTPELEFVERPDVPRVPVREIREQVWIGPRFIGDYTRAITAERRITIPPDVLSVVGRRFCLAYTDDPAALALVPPGTGEKLGMNRCFAGGVNRMRMLYLGLPLCAQLGWKARDQIRGTGEGSFVLLRREG
jgi:RNA polymerase sigma factor (sigma-70 family)